MDWACHVAELRLWLALIIDADFTPEELHIRSEPLLPHFTFKIRCGDSLVQEVGGINLGHIRASHDIPPPIKARITSLKTEKLKFYNNDKTCQFGSIGQVAQEELHLFRDILAAREHKVHEDIKSLQRKIDGVDGRRIRLDGTVEQKPQQIKLAAIDWQKQIESLTDEMNQIEYSRTALDAANKVPFVWDIAFVEVFEGENEGFDIVVGNPPYVERHKIRDPLGPTNTGQGERKAYMAKLGCSVYGAFPQYFRPKASGKTARQISAMSDLYIYFYFRGLSLVNPRGSFCFITSNSWLDVGYGKDLQEFLLKHCHIKMVLDNQPRRSFASVDVNTIIVLLSAPDDRHEWATEKIARFVMFKVPFEHIISPIIFDEIEDALDRRITPEYRVFPIHQEKLFDDGCDLLETHEACDDSPSSTTLAQLIKVPCYIGNKWGGRYLRAPEIYWTIRERGSLVPIGRYAAARLGVTTGANEFFFIRQLIPGRYITNVGGDPTEISLPDEFTQPVIRTVSECKDITFHASETAWRIAVLPETVTDPEARAYVTLAEQQGIQKRPFFRGKRCWFSLSSLPVDTIAVPEIVYARYFFLWNMDRCVLNKNFYGFVPYRVEPSVLWGLLNCSYSFLQFELSSRKPGAGASGISVDVANRILVVPLRSIADDEQKAIQDAGKALQDAPIREVWDDTASQERRGLDNIVFDILGLTQGERDAVYEALIQLVEARLKKAESV